MIRDNSSGMKIAFATCVQLGKSCIEEILRIGGKLDLIITLPDNYAKEKSGRVYLDETAQKANTSILKTKNINDEVAIRYLKERRIDWLFIIGWSQIARKEVLKAPLMGCIGMHPTLLPEGRGRASIPWAILKGLSKTGVTMFKLDEGVDTGEIIGQDEIFLTDEVDATELYNKVVESHVKLINMYWNDIINNTVKLIKQDEDMATYWPQRRPEDGALNNNMTINEASRLVRAVTHPYPGAYFIDKQRRIKVWKATYSEFGGDYHLSDGYMTPIDFEIEALNE